MRPPETEGNTGKQAAEKPAKRHRRSPAKGHRRGAVGLALEAERGFAKADATHLFARVAATSPLPTGKLRAELIPDSSRKRARKTLGPQASQTAARLSHISRCGAHQGERAGSIGEAQARRQNGGATLHFHVTDRSRWSCQEALRPHLNSDFRFRGLRIDCLSHAESRHDAFDSMGAFLQPGRWHPAGTRVVKAAEHAASGAGDVDPCRGSRTSAALSTRIDIPDDVASKSAAWLDVRHRRHLGRRG